MLQAVSEQDAYANLVLPRQLTEAGLTGRDAALATELGYGTLRARGTLDEVLRRCASRDLDDIQTSVLNLLRLGAYQLLRTRIPTHAAVATTVDLARATGNTRAAGFVNAVLRKVSARDFDGWCDEIARDASPLGALAIRYSHPGWIVAAFADALGVESSEPLQDSELPAALAADDQRPETHLVGWPGRISQAELAAEAGGEPGPYSPYAVRLSSGGEPGALAAVQQHRAGVQDEGSQLCALALAGLPLTGPDERWLDLCAGPGGKAALLGSLAAGRGARLTAVEVAPHRARLV
ncbi:MAG TPA: transcription antitermination factor NusB, partial [Jatrophihabitans sp.]